MSSIFWRHAQACLNETGQVHPEHALNEYFKRQRTERLIILEFHSQIEKELPTLKVQPHTRRYSSTCGRVAVTVSVSVGQGR